MTDTDMKLNEYLEDIRTSKSTSMYQLSRQALKLFSEFEAPKGPTEVLRDAQRRQQSENLAEKKFYSKEIERFYKWLMLKKGYGHNTARVYCGATETFFRTYGINLDVAAGIHKVVAGLKVYVPTVTEFRLMYSIGDLRDRVVLSTGLDLGWRCQDLLSVKKEEINLESTEPVPISRITQKMKEEAHSFVSLETIALLKLYLPQTDPNNPYIFGNSNNKPMSEIAFNDILHNLSARAKLPIPEGKAFTSHAFRKRLLSQAVDVGIDVNAAKLITGKAVSPDMQPYIESADFKKAWTKLRDSMRLGETSNSAKNHEKIEELERLLTEQQHINKALLERLEKLDTQTSQNAAMIRKLMGETK